MKRIVAATQDNDLKQQLIEQYKEELKYAGRDNYADGFTDAVDLCARAFGFADKLKFENKGSSKVYDFSKINDVDFVATSQYGFILKAFTPDELITKLNSNLYAEDISGDPASRYLVICASRSYSWHGPDKAYYTDNISDARSVGKAYLNHLDGQKTGFGTTTFYYEIIDMTALDVIEKVSHEANSSEYVNMK